MLQRKLENWQYGCAGPAIEFVLHAPRTASSGFSMTCFTCGFSYCFFFFEPFNGFVPIFKLPSFQLPVLSEMNILRLLNSSDYCTPVCIEFVRCRSGAYSFFLKISRQILYVRVCIPALAILTFTMILDRDVECIRP